MTTATDSGAKRPSQSLLRNYGQALNMHMEEIWEKTSADLELQMIVVAVIREYGELKQAATENLQTVGEVMNSAIEGRKRKREQEEDDSGVIQVAPEGQLRRGQHIFGKWVDKLCNELLFFLESRLFDKGVLKRMSLIVKYECMEFALDILCFGDNLDRCAVTDIKPLFENCAKLYRKLGCRFQHVEIDNATGDISWTTCGPWRLLPPDGEDIAAVVVLQAWATQSKNDTTIQVTKQQLLGDEGPFSLVYAFSLKQCALKSDSTDETYSLYTMAPGLRRTLQLRPSDEAGATTLAMVKKSGTQVELEKRASKAKAQPVGVRRLEPPPSPQPKALPATPKTPSPVGKAKSKAKAASPAAAAAEPSPLPAAGLPAAAEAEEEPSPPEAPKEH